MTNRQHDRTESTSTATDPRISDRLRATKTAKTKRPFNFRLPFSDLIKTLARKDKTMLPDSSYEIEIVPSSKQRQAKHSRAVTPGSIAERLVLSGRTDRFWLGQQKSGSQHGQFHSNMG